MDSAWILPGNARTPSLIAGNEWDARSSKTPAGELVGNVKQLLVATMKRQHGFVLTSKLGFARTNLRNA